MHGRTSSNPSSGWASFPGPGASLGRERTAGPRPAGPARRGIRWPIEGTRERYSDDLRLFSDLAGLDVSAWPTSRVLDGSMSADELTERLLGKLGLTGA